MARTSNNVVADFIGFNNAIQMKTISELAEDIGANAGNIVYWEKQFPALKPQLILGVKGMGRMYTEDEARKVRDFKRLLDSGFTCKGARRVWKRRQTVLNIVELI